MTDFLSKGLPVFSSWFHLDFFPFQVICQWQDVCLHLLISCESLFVFLVVFLSSLTVFVSVGVDQSLSPDFSWLFLTLPNSWPPILLCLCLSFHPSLLLSLLPFLDCTDCITDFLCLILFVVETSWSDPRGLEIRSDGHRSLTALSFLRCYNLWYDCHFVGRASHLWVCWSGQSHWNSQGKHFMRKEEDERDKDA